MSTSPSKSSSAKPTVSDRDLQVLKSKVNEYLDGWKRAKADYENLRRRTDEQRLAVVKTATRDLVEQLLPVVDNLERTLAAVRDAKDAGSSLTQGVELVLQQLRDVLAAQGVSVISAKGKKFDPALHEAIAQVDGPAGICVDEHAPGYKLHDVVVRPARVSVGRASLTEPKNS